MKKLYHAMPICPLGAGPRICISNHFAMMEGHLLLATFAQRVSFALVGTGNSSLYHSAFYQKCGFRMDHIRKDYFNYIQPPIVENGIPLRDMLVFRWENDPLIS